MSDRDTKAKEYDAVVAGLRDEPCAFKRQCFRDGWDAAIASKDVTTVRALEVVLSRLKMDPETARIMKAHLGNERSAFGVQGGEA